MIAKINFFVVLVMANGEYLTKTPVVESCPSIKTVGDHYEQRIREGEIKDWNATCLLMNIQSQQEMT